MEKSAKLGKVRVGRRIYEKGRYRDPSYPDFKRVVVMTASSKYSSLSPYCLKDDQGRIMENIWQYSKIYSKVPKSRQTYSRWDKRVIWDHPAETHLKEDGTPREEYWNWREKGMKNPFAIRYPVGRKHRHKCICSITEEGEHLNYIESRKRIYLPVYIDLVKDQQQFTELKERLERGENLLIIEVDGPHQESLDHYKKFYKVDDDFIDQDTILVTKKNMEILLNDPKHPFGHGYCLGMALLGIE